MKKCYLFFSHTLLKEQILELKNKFQCKEIIYLPKELQDLWSNINEDDDYSTIFFEYLERNAKENDYVLVQGEWGATYKMINFCKIKKFIPIYSFSRRVAYEELREGILVKTSYFKHIKFKKYEDLIEVEEK